MEIVIHIENVTQSYADKCILDRINLRFPEGKTHVLLGASGSGKTTLLKMVMGLVVPDQGSVWIDQDQITKANRSALVKKMGYVIQEGGLFPHLNVYDNVTLLAKTLRQAKSAIDLRMDELLQLVGLESSVLSRFPRQLSGGQKQRVALMRALFLDPKFLLLDEPLGALDPIIRSHLQAQMRAIFKKLNKLVLLVTHDIGEAAYFGETVTLLYQGQVLQHGPFPEFLHSPRDPYVTEFIQAQRSLHELEGRP